MQQLNAATLAEFILISYPDKNITPMKLQKLAYYSSFVLNGYQTQQ
jgi:uncharacterized phage-associated protein